MNTRFHKRPFSLLLALIMGLAAAAAPGFCLCAGDVAAALEQASTGGCCCSESAEPEPAESGCCPAETAHPKADHDTNAGCADGGCGEMGACDCGTESLEAAAAIANAFSFSDYRAPASHPVIVLAELSDVSGDGGALTCRARTPVLSPSIPLHMAHCVYQR